MKKNGFKSIRVKLFITLCIAILLIIGFFIIITNTVLETLYYRAKKNSVISTYEFLNSEMAKNAADIDYNFKLALEKIENDNTFDIFIEDEYGQVVYKTKSNFKEEFSDYLPINYTVNYSIFNTSDIMLSNENMTIRKVVSKKSDLKYILFTAKMDNGNYIYIRIPVTPLEINASISNKFIFLLGGVTIILGGFGIIFITNRFTKPIEELNEIANEMSNLNFKRKYRIHDSGDEIDELGKSINTLSDKLEENINQLKKSYSEMEREIEEKSKIDEMRKQFISDVSHELKTPIALIQGYAEGLADNVVTDEEDRKYYIDVILDESNKMDKLVKRLLELMKLEYGGREFNNTKFNLVEVINTVIKNQKVKIENENIEIDFPDKDKEYKVFADDFYIEQVVTNYFTNALKNCEKVNDKKKIKFGIKNDKDEDKLKVTVFNTGKNISQENIQRIWTRFFKIDESRDRSKGGTGIGLSLVKAIMTKYNNQYGVVNKKDGVEFYFEINKAQ